MKKYDDFKSAVLPLVIFGSIVTGVCVGALKFAWDRDHGENLNFGNTKISYSKSSADGDIYYKDVENYLKVITFKKDDVVFDRLCVVKSNYNNGRDGGYFSKAYCDLESGTVLQHYIFSKNTEDAHRTYSVGQELEVVAESDFTNDLYVERNIKQKYSVSELLDVYNSHYNDKDNVKVLEK